MLNNIAFALTDEELASYNKWVTEIAVAMGNAEIESWTLNVNFSFSNLGKTVVAHCESDRDKKGDLLIRDMLE